MKYCEKCGAMMNDTDIQCPNCKNKVAVQVENDVDAKAQKKKKVKKVVLICLGVFLGINILLVAIAMLMPSSDSTDKAADSASKWIKSDTEIAENSGIYYYYDESPDDFVDKINSLLKSLADKSEVDSENADNFYKYDNKTEHEDSDVITYTYTANNNHIMGFYIDCLNGKIIDVRPVIDVTTVFSNGQGKDDLYGNMALNTALALCAYEGIEESQIDEVYKVIYNSMCNEKTTGWYINGFFAGLKTVTVSSQDTLFEVNILKMDKDLYKKTKETGEKAGNKSIEINLNQTESTTENTTTSAQIEKTEISDLFSGDLEDAKKVLGNETEAEKNLDSYTRHTFGDIVIMCEYGTNNIYSIAINYTDDTRNRYTAFGLDGNSKKTDWSKRLGNELSSNYDFDGDNVYTYENDYKGNTFNIEITVSDEVPDKITVFKQYNGQ